MNGTFDIKHVDDNIAKLKDDWIAYTYKSPNQTEGKKTNGEDDIEKEGPSNKEGGVLSDSSSKAHIPSEL